MKKIVVKISRHPYINISMEEAQNRTMDNRVRKCRVQVERLNFRPVLPAHSEKPKRCIVRIARINDVDLARREISAAPTPASSIVCSDFEEEATN